MIWGRDYIDRRADLIAAVDVPLANRVAARLLDPGALTFAIAGRSGEFPAGLGEVVRGDHRPAE